MIDLPAATAAMGLARRAITRRVVDGRTGDPAVVAAEGPLPPALDAKRGVFVTLNQHPSGRLRGCIGFPLPIYPLRIAVPQAAVSAAVEDPRFPPLLPDELPGVRIELSFLTVPERIAAVAPTDRVAAVRIGTDGLILDGARGSGLLLPQVATEQGWGAERFLDGVAEKAGLERSAWKRPETRLHRFQAELFEEDRPDGATRPTRPRP